MSIMNKMPKIIAESHKAEGSPKERKMTEEEEEGVFSSEGDENNEDYHDQGIDLDLNMDDDVHIIRGKEAFDKNKSGVIYMSFIPPFLKPSKVRQQFKPFGEVRRIFFAEKTNAKKGSKNGKKNRKIYSEGWIEFYDKKKARLAAETLNSTNIGGRKRSFHYNDLWALKYLPKFKWDDLIAQIQYERQARQAKARQEMQTARQQNAEYIRNIKKAKIQDKIKKRKEDKEKAEGAINVDTHQSTSRNMKTGKQKAVVDSQSSVGANADKDLAKVISRLL